MTQTSPRETLDRNIQQLKDDILVLGSMVEQALLKSVDALKRQDLTLILTRESSHLFGEGIEGQLDASIQFLADTYIMLRYVEIESVVQRAIIVLKMRGSAHDSAIRQYEINSHGIKVLQPFEGREGLLSGTPKRMTDSFMRAFVRR